MRTRRIAARMTRRLDLPRSVFYATLFAAGVVGMTLTASAESAQTAVQSPDGRNSIVLGTAGDAAEHVRFTVSRDGREIIRPSLLGPVLAAGRSLGDAARIVSVQHGKVNESFQLLWGQTGFDFIAEVPTTWDETRFLAGDPGEYVVVARRKADAWYVGGITNWTPREIDVPVDFLAPGEFAARLYVDGCSDEAHPNAITQQRLKVNTTTPFRVSLAPGGGFVAILRASPAVRAKRAGR